MAGIFGAPTDDDEQACCAGDSQRRWGPTLYAAVNGAAAVAALVVLILVADGGSDLEARSHGAAAVVLGVGSLCQAEAVAVAAMRTGVPGAVARLRELMAAAAIGAVSASIATSPVAVGAPGALIAGSTLVFLGTAAAVVSVVWAASGAAFDEFT